MASRPLQDAIRNVGRNALDLPVAALAALAVAFLAFAMPSDLLTNLVAGSGLPSVLPAAEPPLGFKARIGAGLAGAAAMFGIVFVLLRLLDRTGLDSAKAKPEIDAEPQAPRLRRRDSHPDAPTRRPISATRDFGEPAPPSAPTPSWLAAAEPEAVAFEPEPEPVAAAPASLDELMARLEQGLSRRRAHKPSASPPAPAAPQVFPEPADDRLQSAIDSLQRLAARQS